MKTENTSVTWIYLNLRKIEELSIFKGSAKAEIQYVLCQDDLYDLFCGTQAFLLHNCKKQRRMMFYLMSVNLLPFGWMTVNRV